MNLHEGHRSRLKARFLKEGLDGFEEHNALELILFYARPRQDTNPIAHALIQRFGSFAAVVEAPIKELEKVEGVGHNTAVLLKMIPELSNYYVSSRTKSGTVLAASKAAGQFFVPRFVGKINEELHIALLDDKRKLLRAVFVNSDGIANAVPVSVKKIVAEALNANATGILLAHNHPAGVAVASVADKEMTRRVYQALQHVHVQLVDHIIVAEDTYLSLADTGFMQELQGEPFY